MSDHPSGWPTHPHKNLGVAATPPGHLVVDTRGDPSPPPPGSTVGGWPLTSIQRSNFFFLAQGLKGFWENVVYSLRNNYPPQFLEEWVFLLVRE
jgi:hypothetical protein